MCTINADEQLTRHFSSCVLRATSARESTRQLNKIDDLEGQHRVPQFEVLTETRSEDKRALICSDH
jgi:hypothetical protein